MFWKRYPGDGKTLRCEACGKPYYITPIEIAFCTQQGAAIGSLCRVCKRARADQGVAEGQQQLANVK